MRWIPSFLCAFLWGLLPLTAGAGGSGLNVVVVVNQNSAESLQVGNDYCELRGVPPQNVLRLTNQWSGGSISATADEFQTNLLNPLFSLMAAQGLTNQIAFVLLSMDIPYQVTGTNGLNSATSVLFYGFKPDVMSPAGLPISCSLPDNSSNSFAFSETPFFNHPPSTALTNAFLTVMLTDSNLAGAESILRRAVAADGSFPSQPIYLEKTSDQARNVRFTEFDNAVFEARVLGDNSLARTNSDSTAFTNLFGLETGLTTFSLPTNAFESGALADDLTSYGGMLFTDSGQTPILAFLEAGAAGSYGTVVEPCNYPQKFPNPLDYFYQRRGFTLAESYYMSVQNPYQGLMVGEPLSAPFAQPGAGVWSLPAADNAMISGTTALAFTFEAADSAHPLSQVDLFIDGTWFETVTNIPPPTGGIVSITINGISNGFTVPTNATLSVIEAGLAASLNGSSNSTTVRALPFGDRVELHGLAPTVPGAGLTVTAASTSSNLFPLLALPSCLDSIATGFHYLSVYNTPQVGDWLQLTATKTNGEVVAVAVTNTTSGETLWVLAQTLVDGVNGNPELQGADGIYIDDFAYMGSAADFNVYARQPGWPAAAIQVTVTSSSNLMAWPSGTSLLEDNLSDLQPRDSLRLLLGRTNWPVTCSFDTTPLSDGVHQFTAVAYEGTSVRTQARLDRTVVVQNTPLTATLQTVFGGSNTDVNATLQFSVAANSNAISYIALFSTGGLLASVTNQPTATFAVAGTNLGVGLHPFYAVVTDNSGHHYRTATTLIRLIGTEPAFSATVTANPVTLHWTATAGRVYTILSSTNLTGPFQTNAVISFPNSAGLWPVTNTNAAAQFYLLKASY